MEAVLGVLAAMVISMLSVGGFVHWAKLGVQNVQTAAAASQLIVFDKAAAQYVQDNAATIASTATANTPVTITAAMLSSAGYLPQGFTALNPWRQLYEVQVLQPTSGQLQALVTGQGGAAVSDPKQLMQVAAQAAAGGGGYIPYNDQMGDASMSPSNAYGAFGIWGPVSLADYTNPGAGHLASLLAFGNTQTNNDYLYRVQVPGHPELNAMQTDLSMTDTGGTKHNISGADVISAQSMQALSGGSLTTPSITTANGTVITWDQVPNGGVLSLKGANGTWVHLQSVNGTFTLVNSALTANLFTVDQSGNVVAAGSISAAGQIHATGTTSANCPSTGTCGVTSSDVYANNTVGVGPAGGSAAVQMSSNGDLTANDTIQAGSKVVLGTAFGSAVVGGSCSPNGEIAADADGSGQLLACQAGSWVAAGLPVGVVGSSCSIPGGLGQDNTGTGLVCQAGVWTLIQARMGSWVMMGSYYTQNGWWVPKPVCTGGSSPRILVGFGGTNTVNNSGTVNQSATDLGNGNWRVNILDGWGNGLPGYTLAQTYCAFD